MEQIIIDVLLVEDRAEDAELAMMGLQKYNLVNKIDWVKDGEEALEYLFCKGRYAERCRESRPKLVLLDLKMPKIDGIEVLKQLRSNESTKNIPVVVMTTSKEEQDIVNAYNLGVNAYILKPVDFRNFTDAMKVLGKFWVLLNQRPY